MGSVQGSTSHEEQQIECLRAMVADDEGARLVLAVFQYRPESEIKELMREYIDSQAAPDVSR